MTLKRLVSVLIITFFMFVSVSCSMFGSTTQKYINAFKNTESAKTMQTRTQLKVKVDLSKASDEVKKNLDQFKDITLNVDGSIDKRNNKQEASYYLSAGNIMTNFNVYVDEDNIYLKSSFPDTGNKYLKLDPENSGLIVTQDSESFAEYNKFYNELVGIWKQSIQGEILESEGNSIESTPDGEIKVTQLSLELTDQKTKNILDKLTNLAAKSEVIKKSSIENGKMFAPEDISDEVIEKGTKEFFENLPQNIGKYMEKFTIEKLKLTAKIDKDQYIIDETIEVEALINDDDAGEIRISFDIYTTRWNIDKDIKLSIPEINEDDTVSEDEFQEEALKFYKEFINSKEQN